MLRKARFLRAQPSPSTVTKLRPLGQDSHISRNPRLHPNGPIVSTSHSTDKKQEPKPKSRGLQQPTKRPQSISASSDRRALTCLLQAWHFCSAKVPR